MATKITNKLIQLPPEVSIDRVVDHPDSLELFLSYPEQPRLCPFCGSSDCVIKDSGRQLTIRHIPVSSRGSFLTFHVPRLLCKNCRSSFSQRPYFAHPSMKISTSAWLAVCEGLMTTHSLRDIAIDCGLTEAQVVSILSAVDFDPFISLPRTLCIDEFKGSSGDYDPPSNRWHINKYHCNIADGDHGCVIDVLPRIDLPFLLDYFNSYSLFERQRVQFFCCDMHSGFISLAKRCFPNVRICIDMFHVVKLLNENVTEIRRALQRSLREQGNEEAYTLLKHSARLLTTSAFNQVNYWGHRFAKNRKRLDQALSLSEELDEAYTALQEFHSILEESSYHIQRVRLSDWLAAYTSSPSKGTRHCANTIRHYRVYIQNSMKYGKSNGPCEGLNNRIKILKRNGYGVHSFDLFRKRVLFCCGQIKLVRQTYTNALELSKPQKNK